MGFLSVYLGFYKWPSTKSSWECRVRERPRKPKERKWAKDAQEETNGTQELISNVIKGPMTILSHWETNKQQAQRGLARLGQITS